MENIFEEIGIPKKYLKATNRENTFVALVHKLWLKSLVKNEKLGEFIERSRLDSWPTIGEEIGPHWTRIFIRIFQKKDAKVIPLPRIRAGVKDESPLMFAQLMQYIHLTNFKNLWKEAYKKYISAETNKETHVNLVDYNEVLREVITRIYGCPIVNSECPKSTFEAHLNVLPALCAVETLNAIFVLHSAFFEHNLRDCVTFSPALLDKCIARPLFIVYQLLQILKDLHDHSLTLGDISLSDIYLNEDLWINVFPAINSNIYVQKLEEKEAKIGYDCRKSGHKFDQSLKCDYCGIKTYDKIQIRGETLENLCRLWIEGQISNFSYISILNRLSGRKLSDPNCHYVFPWVTDFMSRCGKNWRDLKKSKYRLNKGDRQLDLTYENSEFAHHVSDVLSPITYYVYMARRTPKSVLCKNVRTIWVPAEYPSSIQRLQEWTPDECIPEFFTDPSVFRSIHDDLDDLDVPSWCTGPEDFIDKHRELLESQHVSERLHHWIDLTFGYKLAGNAAIKSKNVCLNLVDNHSRLTKSGIVQLFTHPHPPKVTTSIFLTKSPKVHIKRPIKRTRDRSSSPCIATDLRNEEETEDQTNRSPLGLSRFLSRSRSSLNEDEKKTKSNQRSVSLGPKNPTFTSHVTPKSNGFIYLPKEYKPESALDLLERKHQFFAKSFHPEHNRFNYLSDFAENETFEENSVQNAFTNLIFTENYERHQTIKSHTFPSDNQTIFFYNYTRNKCTNNQKNDNQIICNYSEIISQRRIRELQIIGCLIVEIFMAKQLRALGANDANLSFVERLKFCLIILKSCQTELPAPISRVVKLLLQPELNDLRNFKYPSVTDLGLPSPSAHLLLEPLLNCIIPFPKYFPDLYKLISCLKDLKNVTLELNILYHFECNGEMCAEYENLERTKILFAQNIGECKVKTCAKQLEKLLDLNMANQEVINILSPYIRELIEEPATSVLAAWYLFDPFARVLGPENTQISLLECLLKLYETEPNETTLPYNNKIAKLYHHSFLLRLMVRLGLKCFLENFVVPLVEAIGRYKDYEKVDFIPHNHSEKTLKRTSHLKTFDDREIIREKVAVKQMAIAEPEMFEFEDNEEQLKSLIEHLELNVASDLPFNVSTAEEALLDTTLTDNANSDHLSQDCDFNTITCEIGSRKSDDSSYLSDKLSSGERRRRMSTRSIKRQDAKISDMSSDSLIWLSHRLGPVLTARYLSRNLLKMLTLCYVGQDNLTIIKEMDKGDDVSVGENYVQGDHNALKVLECLASIAGLYGEQFILFQYIPHMSELILLCKRKLTLNLEGGLISCLALLKYTIPYLSDATLMDQLQDVILKNIIHPTVRLLGSSKYTFPSGAIARNVLARKYIDTLYVLSIRLGSDMTRAHLAVPALQRFFLIFDKIHQTELPPSYDEAIPNEVPLEESQHYIEVRRDGTITEWSLKGKPLQISHVLKDSEDSLSPPSSQLDESGVEEELKRVFTAELAYVAYLPFLKLIGEGALQISLKNHKTIRDLCQDYEQDFKLKYQIPQIISGDNKTMNSSSIGSNISLIGNRIDVQENLDVDLLSYVSNKMENTSRHLRGNWLAYWEHEIGRSDKDSMFNFKQIKLQTFIGHNNSIKCLTVLDNENSFMSGSRDKTVKLWSLRSQGDGTNNCNCQWTYTAHKKSVLSLCFIECMRLVASSDSVVHIWDPFMGVNVAHLESHKYSPVNILKTMPAPSPLFYAATTEGTVKVVDARICAYSYELKISISPNGLIRALTIAPNGQWVATGQSSGIITVLDTRTGLVLSNWRAHEGEVLQLVAYSNDTLISTSLDQNISVWNVTDGKFKFHMRGTTEPVHCLNVYNNELISGTTANRIGVHTSIDLDCSFSSTKLRSDAFKGVMTAMAVLPLNRLLLLGADTGMVSLLC